MLNDWMSSLPLLLAFAVLGWIPAYLKRNVNIVDSLWSLFFLVAGITYLVSATEYSTAQWLLVLLLALWALRLSLHLALRNAGKQEDHRYAAMRARNPQRFAWRCLITVFGLQAVLAWFISLPLAAALGTATPLGAWHILGLALFALGFGFEAVADWQLHHFRREEANRGKVLDRGLWRLSRHPNYFGEACIWWSFYLFALATGAFWTFLAPLLMTFLLLRVSGVSMMEKNITQRKPEYRDYMARTPAFFPRLPRLTTPMRHPLYQYSDRKNRP